jgi:spore coat polysaccharide biosynthesis protein SpsF
MKIVAIIQARMGSSRLPGKMLMLLAGVPVIQWVYDRASRIDGVQQVLIATTDSNKDDPLATFCKEHDLPVFRGSEDDVLDRYYQAAQTIPSDAIVRITGDCPLLDPVESAKVVALFQQTPDADYASNIEPPTLPDGLDTEIIRSVTLKRIWRDVNAGPYREHVTYYVRRHPEQFKTTALQHIPDLSQHRWTLDNSEDYTFLNAVANELKQRRQFGHLEEVLAILRDHPELLAINQHLERNAGLKKALQQAQLKG